MVLLGDLRHFIRPDPLCLRPNGLFRKLFLLDPRFLVSPIFRAKKNAIKVLLDVAKLLETAMQLCDISVLC